MIFDINSDAKLPICEPMPLLIFELDLFKLPNTNPLTKMENNKH